VVCFPYLYARRFVVDDGDNRLMVDTVEHTDLRALIGPIVVGLRDGYRHDDLPEVCRRLSLPSPPQEGTKAERLEASLEALPDTGLDSVIVGLLRQEVLSASQRRALEDALWAKQGSVEIPQRVRREIARALDLEDLTQHSSRFMDLLARFWLPDDDLFGLLIMQKRQGLRAEVERHVLRNPGDWSTEDLFEKLGAFAAPHPRFVRFLEALVSADLVPDEPIQRRLVAAIDPCLRTAGVEVRETGVSEGYPVFALLPSGLARNRRPKNLIFASKEKPDLRFRNAVDNDIEVVGDQDHVLIYDRPIGSGGIRWRDLQDWWQQTRDVTDAEEAKRGLYQRLRESLPDTSRAQHNLFVLYHRIFGVAVPELPALLPEVWLHWDPKTVQQRGREALLRFRMDFLLLLPHGQRVVLEVDGSQHFTNRTKYAADMRADRELKLSGYEVFRFGTAELEHEARARRVLEEFFVELFRRFDVTPHGR
jgi:very-short-patch-repair endonuclease